LFAVKSKNENENASGGGGRIFGQRAGCAIFLLWRCVAGNMTKSATGALFGQLCPPVLYPPQLTVGQAKEDA
jgi:hypothetical protein